MDVPILPSPHDVNAFFRERFEALLHEFGQVGDNAVQDQVLNNLDAFLFVKEREFLTEFLETKMRERINNAEKPAEVKQCPHCKKTKNIGKMPKTVTTANNHIRLVRTYRHCGDYKTYAYPADQLIGSAVAVEVTSKIETKLKDNVTVRKDFQKAKGETEFTTDGAFVNMRN